MKEVSEKVMKKLLIFDAYGTLISTGNGSITACEKILALQKQKIDKVAFYAEWKKYHRLHMKECNEGIFVPEREIFTRDLQKLYCMYGIERPYEKDVEIMLESLLNRVVFPEVIETVTKLRKKYRVVIGSTTDTEPLLQNLQVNQLVVDEVYTSEMIGKYKPSEEFYHYILQAEQCKPKEAVFIGDSLIDDVDGPQKLGINAIRIDRKGTTNAAIKDLKELENIL